MLLALKKGVVHTQGGDLARLVLMPDILTAIDVSIIRQEGQGKPQDVEAPTLEFVHEQQQEFLEAAQLEPFVEDVALQGHAAAANSARHRGLQQAVGGAVLGHHRLDRLG